LRHEDDAESAAPRTSAPAICETIRERVRSWPPLGALFRPQIESPARFSADDSPKFAPLPRYTNARVPFQNLRPHLRPAPSLQYQGEARKNQILVGPAQASPPGSPLLPRRAARPPPPVSYPSRREFPHSPPPSKAVPRLGALKAPPVPPHPARQSAPFKLRPGPIPGSPGLPRPPGVVGPPRGPPARVLSL